MHRKELPTLRKGQKYAIYKRISTDKQCLNRQNEVIERYLELHGIDKSDCLEFADTESAYRKTFEARLKFNQMLRLAMEKSIVAIIVADTSRITRQMQEHFWLRSLFSREEIPVFIATNGQTYETSSPSSLLQQIMGDAITKYESDNISQRTRDVLYSLYKTRGYSSGRVPFGYRLKETKGNRDVEFEENPREINIIKELFIRLFHGSTVKELTDYAKHQDADGNWTEKKIRYVLKNPIYTGHFVPNHYQLPMMQWEWKPWNWMHLQPVVSKGTFCSFWETEEENRRKNRSYRNTPYWFQGLFSCDCGSSMIGKDQRTNINGTKGPYGGKVYICSGTTCKRRVGTERLHQLFRNYLKTLAIDEEKVRLELVRRHEVEEEILQDNIEEDKSEISKIKQLLHELPRIEPVWRNKEYLRNLLPESVDEETMTILIAYKWLQGQLEHYQGKMEYAENRLTLIEKMKQDPQPLVGGILKDRIEFFEEHLAKGEMKDSYDAFMRKMVLLLVKECQYLGNDKIKLTLRSLKELTI